MMAVSTNIGFSKVFDRLGGARLERWLRRFHFGAAPGDLPVPIEDKSFRGAVVAIGEAMTASPLQLAAAYAVFANDGAYVAPTLNRREGPAPRERMISPETARAIVSMLEGVVTSERATGKAARVAGVRVAGKTGTAELSPGGKSVYASFVGIAPVERPRFVILVGVEDPRGGESGGKVAAPVFARIAARALGG
jgi:cell division protein FtsI (penicillin-binding protein 3)